VNVVRAALVGLLAVTACLAASPTQAVGPSYAFTPESVSAVPSVSPEVHFRAATGTYFLYTTGMSIGVYSSADGETWAPVAGAVTPTGPYSDASVIDMPDGTYRMYLTERVHGATSPCAGKQLRYATSADLVRWTLQPAILLADIGCGVPDVVRDGSSFLLYYVRGGVGVEHGIYRATSPDGLAWTPEPGIITPADMVDPSVVKVAESEWLMMTADFPSGKPTAPFFQKLYVATSADGRSWDFGDRVPVYAPTEVGVFDPNLNLMPDGTLKAWFARGAGALEPVVAYGVLSAEAAPALMAPERPTVAFAGKRKVVISWAHPAGGATPESFILQRRRGSTWVPVTEVGPEVDVVSATRKSLSVVTGDRLVVRIVAVRGDERKASPQARAIVP